MLEDIGALLPIALGPVRTRARGATAAGDIVAVLMVVMVVLGVPQLLQLLQLLGLEPLSAHISQRRGQCGQVPSRLASRMVSEQLPEQLRHNGGVHVADGELTRGHVDDLSTNAGSCRLRQSQLRPEPLNVVDFFQVARAPRLQACGVRAHSLEPLEILPQETD